MSDLYFDEQWEADHPYLASLWRRLLAAPGQRLSAFVPGLECSLLLDHIGSGRVVLQWKEKHFVAAYDLSGLFQKAFDNGLAFEVNDQTVPLESWLRVGVLAIVKSFVTAWSDQTLADRYVEETLKLKKITRWVWEGTKNGGGSARARGMCPVEAYGPKPCESPNIIMMNVCKRELERRGLSIPQVSFS